MLFLCQASENFFNRYRGDNGSTVFGSGGGSRGFHTIDKEIIKTGEICLRILSKYVRINRKDSFFSSERQIDRFAFLLRRIFILFRNGVTSSRTHCFIFRIDLYGGKQSERREEG